MPKRGIVKKTFLFTSAIVTLVSLLSLAILYFVMPQYYQHKKSQTLDGNLRALVAALKEAGDVESCAALISGFVGANNVSVLAHGADGAPIAALSSPFVSMETMPGEDGVFYVQSREGAGGEATSHAPAYISQFRVEIRPDDGSGLGGWRSGGYGGMAGWAVPGPGSLGDVGQNTPAGPAGPPGDAGLKAPDAPTNGQGYVVQRRALQLDDAQGIFSLRTARAGDDFYQRAYDLVLSGEIGTQFVSSISVRATLQPIDEAQGVILSLIPYVLAAAIAIGLLSAWGFARRLSRPILALSDAAIRMRRMEPGVASGIRTGDEIGYLSENFDAMYATLLDTITNLQAEMELVNRIERSKTEMMQAASHELKTPIAALAGMLDGMIDGVGVYKDRGRYLAECRRQADKLSDLVGEIMEAARADAAKEAASGEGPAGGARAAQGQGEDVAVDALVEQALRDNDALVRQRGLRVVADIEPTGMKTDGAALARAVGNLIGNAARHTPAGGAVRVAVRGGVLEVENDCAHIADDELQKLFEPFYTRSVSRDRADSGTGLGLYIVRRLLERLGIPYDAQSPGDRIRITLALGGADTV